MSEYTPSLGEIVMGKTYLGDNFWRDLTEDEILRGIARVREEAWDEGWDASERFGYPADPLETYENPYRAARIEQGGNDD